MTPCACPCACATEDNQPFSHFLPLEGGGGLRWGARYFLSLRTLIYQGAAISTGQLANWVTKLID